MATKLSNPEKWLSWCDKFYDETKDITSVADIVLNKNYKKLNNLKDQQFADFFVGLLKSDVESNQCKYLKLFPIMYKFYPGFVVEFKDHGDLKLIAKKLVKYVDQINK